MSHTEHGGQASDPALAVSLTTHYGVLSDSDDHVRGIWATATVEEVASDDASGDAPIIQLVNKILTQSFRDRASDIHIEPTDGRVRVRYRVDGSMREVLSLPASTGTELVTRIKVMADMDIIERRRSQDGQFPIVIDGANVDVRISTGATIWGEIAVLRLLDKSRSLKQLSDLGMPVEAMSRAQDLPVMYGAVPAIRCRPRHARTARWPPEAGVLPRVGVQRLLADRLPRPNRRV